MSPKTLNGRFTKGVSDLIFFILLKDNLFSYVSISGRITCKIEFNAILVEHDHYYICQNVAMG